MRVLVMVVLMASTTAFYVRFFFALMAEGRRHSQNSKANLRWLPSQRRRARLAQVIEITPSIPADAPIEQGPFKRAGSRLFTEKKRASFPKSS
jgi:hypothetical protein